MTKHFPTASGSVLTAVQNVGVAVEPAPDEPSAGTVHAGGKRSHELVGGEAYDRSAA